jgi:glycosyl transferase family 2
MSDPEGGSNRPCVSIGLPTYNGVTTLRATLECILSQWEPGLELVICDDNSSDGTPDLIRSIVDGRSGIFFEENESNLGMDGNFSRVAFRSTGEYVWFFGQDDLMKPGTVARVLDTLRSDSGIGIVYLNYSQHTSDMERILTPSYLATTLADTGVACPQGDVRFDTPAEFFTVFEKLPTFLPATIVRRDFWDGADVSPFEGTAYTQWGILMLNAHRGSIHVVCDPLVQGRIPSDGWQSDGRQHFNIFTGSVKAYKIVATSAGYELPEQLLPRMKRRYLLNYFFLVRLCRTRGLVPGPEQMELLKSVFGHGMLYRLYLLPILFFPLWCLQLTNVILLPTKRLALGALRLARVRV